MAKSDRTVLNVEKRTDRGTRAAKRLRRTGFVPGIFYGSDSESLAIKLDEKELRKALATGSQLFDVTVESGNAEPAVIKEHQRHPINGASLHLDLMKVKMDEEIQASVPIVLEGGEEAPGVKEGGIIEHVTRELNVEALPSDMPEQITVDVSGMEAAETFLLDQLPEQPNCKILDDPELVIATITVPKEEEEPEPEIEEEAELIGEEVPEGEEGAEVPEEGEEGVSSEEQPEEGK